MTSADDFFWTYEQAVSYYKFTIVNYMGFRDKGMLLAGGCGDTNGKPQIDKTNHLREAYDFGKNIYREQSQQKVISCIHNSEGILVKFEQGEGEGMKQNTLVEIIEEQTGRALWEVRNLIDCVPDQI